MSFSGVEARNERSERAFRAVSLAVSLDEQNAATAEISASEIARTAIANGFALTKSRIAYNHATRCNMRSLTSLEQNFLPTSIDNSLQTYIFATFTGLAADFRHY